MLRMRFSKLKEKTKKEIVDISYYDNLITVLVNMFDYIPYKNNKEYVETILLTNSMCAFWYDEKEKDYVFSYCERVGNIDNEGLGNDLFCVTLNGHSKTFKDFKNSKDVVLIYNNSTHTPDFSVQKTGDLLTETYISMRNNVINTRYSKIYRSANDYEKTAFQTAIENSMQGIPQTFVSDNLLSDDSNKIIDLNDVSKIDKIQYLTNFYNFLYRDFYNKIGLYTQGSEKVAQQTEAEINEGSSVSFVEVLDRLNERLKGFKEIKTKFTIDIDIKLSECWQREYDRLFNKKVGEEDVSNDTD